jgi:hypothetical protein
MAGKSLTCSHPKDLKSFFDMHGAGILPLEGSISEANKMLIAARDGDAGTTYLLPENPAPVKGSYLANLQEHRILNFK